MSGGLESFRVFIRKVGSNFYLLIIIIIFFAAMYGENDNNPNKDGDNCHEEKPAE